MYSALIVFKKVVHFLVVLCFLRELITCDQSKNPVYVSSLVCLSIRSARSCAKKRTRKNHFISRMSIYSHVLSLGHSVAGAVRPDCATNPRIGWDRNQTGILPKRASVFRLAFQKSQRGQRVRD